MSHVVGVGNDQGLNLERVAAIWAKVYRNKFCKTMSEKQAAGSGKSERGLRRRRRRRRRRAHLGTGVRAVGRETAGAGTVTRRIQRLEEGSGGARKRSPEGYREWAKEAEAIEDSIAGSCDKVSDGPIQSSFTGTLKDLGWQKSQVEKGLSLAASNQ